MADKGPFARPRILMVSSEASPWAKSGGLADVLGALPPALARLGHAVGVVLPRYMGARSAPARRVIDSVIIGLGSRLFDVSVWEMESGGVRMFFVDEPSLYERDGLYGGPTGDFSDNHIRFALLSKAAIEISRRLFRADVFHCHDWQASLVPVYLREWPAIDPQLLGARTVLTIHNLGYQGIFDAPALRDISLPQRLFTPAALEFWGRINLLKGGIVFSDALTTVSRKYAEEIQTAEYGFGLDGLLRSRSGALTGILNGADYSRWDPEFDPLIPARYSAENLAGKAECKRALLAEAGLPEAAQERPLMGIVSRFTSQKGFDLIADAAWQIFEDDVYLVALGNGEPAWEDLFRNLQQAFPGKVSVTFGYNEAMSHRIEAGADMFLMPSRYEPCGLNQIYSLRYGTPPVVRATGGLDDTIDETTGFKFSDYNGTALLEAIRAACRKWEDHAGWRKMMVTGMRRDFSWTASATEYSRLYDALHPAGA